MVLLQWLGVVVWVWVVRLVVGVVLQESRLVRVVVVVLLQQLFLLEVWGVPRVAVWGCRI